MQFVRLNSLLVSQVYLWLTSKKIIWCLIIVFQYLITVLFFNTYAIDWCNQGSLLTESAGVINVKNGSITIGRPYKSTNWQMSGLRIVRPCKTSNWEISGPDNQRTENCPTLRISLTEKCPDWEMSVFRKSSNDIFSWFTNGNLTKLNSNGSWVVPYQLFSNGSDWLHM